MPINFDLESIRIKHGCINYLETGLYNVDDNVSCKQALAAGFEKVISVEIRKDWVEKGQRILSAVINSGRLQIIHDDSTNLKAHLTSNVFEQRTLFFLDAHVDNSNIHNYRVKCPLFYELEAIKSLSRNDHVICIDDVRILKCNSPWGEQSYGQISYIDEIIKVLLTINPSYKIEYLNGHIENDVLIASIKHKDDIMSIHTFGDSHAMFGFNKIKDIKVHYTYSMLCYSFGSEKLNRLNIKNFQVKDEDTVIFCLGEIDCRCHIHKHITPDRTYQMIIDDIVENYFDAINLNKTSKVCVYNVLPPVHKLTTPGNRDLPYLGTDEERKTYVLYFNSKLREKCIENNFIFIDIYDKYTDEDGYLNKKLSDGIVHISDESYLREFIDKHIR
jgi:hypothetical protein